MVRKHKVQVPVVDIEKIYYSSRSHSQASKVLSEKYGLTSRAWRYRLRKYEETGFLSPESLKIKKTRDLLKIHEIRKKVKKERVREVGEVMLTVHFKIKYEKIGGRGFHPFYLEGFYSKRVPRDFTDSTIFEMMNWVHEKLSEFGDLTAYLQINKQDYEEGIEVEELTATHKRDDEFKYDYRRR
jgi:hypothetical protein